MHQTGPRAAYAPQRNREYDLGTATATAAATTLVGMNTRTSTPLIGALIFLLLYLAVSPVAGAFSIGDLPLPGSPPATVHDYLAVNTVPSLLTGLLQALSGIGLAVVVGSLPRAVDTDAAPLRTGVLGRLAGWIAVAAILLSAALSVVLGLISPTATTDTVALIRNFSFYSGGVTHVVALGVFVLAILAFHRSGKALRVLAAIAGGLAVASVLSTVIFYASLFLPVGRLACMVVLVVAGIIVARGRSIPAVAEGDRPRTRAGH